MSKALVIPYDMRLDDGVYTLVVSLVVIDDGENTYHTVYPTSTVFNPLLPNWKSKCLTAVDAYADDNELDIDQVMFLPDFSLLGL